MNISIIQPDLVWEDKSRNLENIGELIAPLYDRTDLVVLPEMFNTGFSIYPDKLGELSDGETFDWMINTSKKGNFGLCGSYIVKDKKQFFNRWVFVNPEEECWYYNKRHLFRMAGEDKYFSPGKSRLIFTFMGVRISPYICYDIRFPVWSRNRNEYDLLIYAANWPESRREVWKTLLKARAIENQCYVAGVNRIGTDGEGIKYCGDSIIVDPRGEIIVSAVTNQECSVSAELSIAELSDFRKEFPVAEDADSFSIKC